MKDRWNYTELEKVCSVDYGTRVVRKRDQGTLFPVYGGGGKTFNLDKFNREDQFVVARFGMSESCTRFVKGKFFLNDSGLTVSARVPNEIYSRFLDYLLLSKTSEIYSLGRGTAQKNLDVDAFKKMEIGYPENFSKQKRIVAILDEAFTSIDQAIANTEKNLQNAKELFESYLNNIFTQKGEDWAANTLAEISEDFGRGKSKHRPRNDPKLYGGIFPFIQTGNVRNSGHLIESYYQTYNDTGLAQSKFWPKGTL